MLGRVMYLFIKQFLSSKFNKHVRFVFMPIISKICNNFNCFVDLESNTAQKQKIPPHKIKIDIEKAEKSFDISAFGYYVRSNCFSTIRTSFAVS